MGAPKLIRTVAEVDELLRPSSRPELRHPKRLSESFDLRDGSDCWWWNRHVDPNGYAQTQHVRAHRWVYELMVAPIPSGLDLDHVCRNRACVNPLHMEPVTRAENNRRRDLANQMGRYKTHCPKGHPYDEENTHVYAGHRQCRECVRAASRAWKAKHRPPTGRKPGRPRKIA